MRTQKYTQVEAIVAKYKNLAKETKVVKDTEAEFQSLMPFYVPQNVQVLEFEQNILAHFYELKVGKEKLSEVSKILELNAQNYISDLLTPEEEEFLNENFDTLVDYLLSNESQWEFQSGSFNAPTEWSDLVPYLLNRNPIGKVLVPNSDKGKIATCVDNCELYVGGDYGYAEMRAYSKNLTIMPHTKISDYEPGMFDLVISEGLPDSFFVANEEYSSELEKTYNLVREGGELLLCLRREELVSEYSQSFRHLLTTKKELADAIILPSGEILLHIVKSPQESFVMVDASTLTRKRGWKRTVNVFDIQRFLELVKICDQPEFDAEPLCRRFSYDVLKEEVFIPSFYLNPFDGGISIASLVESIAQKVSTEECDGTEKVVTVNNLSRTFAKSQFSYESLKNIDTSRYRTYKVVNTPCLVMAISEEGLAIGYSVENNKILVPNNMYVLASSNIIDIRFLASKLCEKATANRLLNLVGGKGINARLCVGWEKLFLIPSCTMEERKDSIERVLLDDYAEQEKMVSSAYANHIHAIRLRKHALSQNISSFDSIFRTLEMCMKEQGGILKAKDKISPISDMTVKDAFAYLHNSLNVIRERVEHISENQDWGKCESIEPQQFVEEYEKTHSSCKFKFSHDWEESEKNCFEENVIDKKTGKLLFHAGESINTAWFPKAALIQVLDNIVSNAQEHGFVDSTRQDYCINFSWSTDGLNLNLRVANNGAPLNTDMCAENVLEYGYSSALNQNGHGGIGGGQISEIMQKYGGYAKIISTPDKQMTVTYVLSMPLASLY